MASGAVARCEWCARAATSALYGAPSRRSHRAPRRHVAASLTLPRPSLLAMTPPSNPVLAPPSISIKTSPLLPSCRAPTRARPRTPLVNSNKCLHTMCITILINWYIFNNFSRFQLYRRCVCNILLYKLQKNTFHNYEYMQLDDINCRNNVSAMF